MLKNDISPDVLAVVLDMVGAGDSVGFLPVTALQLADWFANMSADIAGRWLLADDANLDGLLVWCSIDSARFFSLCVPSAGAIASGAVACIAADVTTLAAFGRFAPSPVGAAEMAERLAAGFVF